MKVGLIGPPPPPPSVMQPGPGYFNWLGIGWENPSTPPPPVLSLTPDLPVADGSMILVMGCVQNGTIGAPSDGEHTYIDIYRDDSLFVAYAFHVGGFSNVAVSIPFTATMPGWAQGTAIVIDGVDLDTPFDGFATDAAVLPGVGTTSDNDLIVCRLFQFFEFPDWPTPLVGPYPDYLCGPGFDRHVPVIHAFLSPGPTESYALFGLEGYGEDNWGYACPPGLYFPTMITIDPVATSFSVTVALRGIGSGPPPPPHSGTSLVRVIVRGVRRNPQPACDPLEASPVLPHVKRAV